MFSVCIYLVKISMHTVDSFVFLTVFHLLEDYFFLQSAKQNMLIVFIKSSHSTCKYNLEWANYSREQNMVEVWPYPFHITATTFPYFVPENIHICFIHDPYKIFCKGTLLSSQDIMNYLRLFNRSESRQRAKCITNQKINK